MIFAPFYSNCRVASRSIPFDPVTKKSDHNPTTTKGLALSSFEATVQTSYDAADELMASGLNPKTQKTLKELVLLNREAYDFINEIDPEGGRLSEDPDFHKREGSHMKSKAWAVIPIASGIESDGSIDKQPAIVFYNKEKNEIRIVFHGTRSGDVGIISDHSGGWATNLDAKPQTLILPEPISAGENRYSIHRGFKKKFDSFKKEMFSALDSVIFSSERLSSEQKMPKIYITGHSQGGAMATLAAIQLDSYMKMRYNSAFDNAKQNAISVYALSPAVLCANPECRSSIEKTLGAHNIIQNYDESDLVPRLAPSDSKLSQLSDTWKTTGTELLPGCHLVQKSSETESAIASRPSAPDGIVSTLKESISSSHFGAEIKRQSSQEITIVDERGKRAVTIPNSDLGFSIFAPDTEISRPGTRIIPSPALRRRLPIP